MFMKRETDFLTLLLEHFLQAIRLTSMWKQLYLTILFISCSFICANAQKSVRVVENDAFGFGEKITYTVKYNLYFNISVGEVNFEITDKPEVIAGNRCYHVIGTGSTYGFYDPFYKVRDRYETYIEENSILPLLFIRNVNEGKFSFNEYVIFNQAKSTAVSKKRAQRIPKFTEDVLSSLYYARTFDFTDAKPGQAFMLTTFIDDSTYHVGVRYVGRVTLNTSLGKIKCIKLKPILIVDRLFKSENSMTLWVTDDANHIPVRVESGISVGKIRADLASWSGLKSPMTSLK